MKFTSRDLVLFFVGVIVTSIVFFFIQKKLITGDKFDRTKLSFNNRDRLKWFSTGGNDDNAEDLMADFNKRNEFKDVLKVRHKKIGGADSTDVPLKGFLFDAGELLEIITDNKSGETPTDVLFYFGSYGNAEEGPGKKHARIRMIAVGVDGKKILNTATNVSLAKFGPPAGPADISCFDNADPTPPW